MSRQRASRAIGHAPGRRAPTGPAPAAVAFRFGLVFLAVAALGLAAWAAAGAGQASAPSAPAGRVQVKVILAHADGSKASAADAVAWLPGAPVADPAPHAVANVVAQRKKTFEPHVEVVTAGTEVSFPNFDRIYHNVFSLSELARFDLGLYRNGASRSMTFAKPGVVRIYCNIHPTMSAFLVVVDGNAYAKTGADGTALLPAVAPGAYRLCVWHERGAERDLDVVVNPGAVTPVEVSVDASRWRSEPHKNKYGKDYPPPDDDQTRY